MKQVTVKKKRSLAKRIIRITIKSILLLVAFFLVIVLLILTPPVQNFLRKKAITYLENKLHTNVAIGKVFIGLPKKIVIEDVYVEDREKDTLLSAGSLKVDVGLWKLIFDGDININKIELKNSTVKIKRQWPDTTFNFQFIADAFSSPESKEKNEKKDIASSALVIRTVELNKIRLVYKDVISGNDVETWLNHFDTHIDKIDFSKSHFDIPRISVSGLIAKVHQVKPLAQPEPVTEDIREASEPANFQLDLKKINLDKIQFDYKNDVSALYLNVNLDETAVKVNKIDLTNQFIDLEEISMDNTNASLRLGKEKRAEIVVKETKQKIKTRRKAEWRIIASSIRFDNNNLSFENDNAPVQKTGMDYAHLKADSLTLYAGNFIFSEDSIGGEIEKATFEEKSGFVLNELKTRFLYASDQSYLRGLYLKTPGTELKREAAIRYHSFAALKNNIGNLQLDADINNSKVLVNDILTFVPALRQQPAFADPSVTWYINSRIKGRLSDLQIDALEIQGLQDTKIDLSGRLTGFPDMKDLAANLNIRNISSSKRDIDLFVPAGILPQNITLPARLNLTGKASGNANNLNTAISINTDLGNTTINGKFEEWNDPKNIKYNASVQITSLALGTILQQEETFGAVTAIFIANGRGTDPKTAEGTFSGKIKSALIKQYNYQNFDLKGSIAMQQVKVKASIIDPNIHFAFRAEGDISKKYPSVFINGMIDSIKFQPLHFTNHTAVYRGKIEADFPVTDPENLQGKLFITESLLVRQEQRLKMDTVKLIAGDNDSGHYISLNSDIVNAELSGKYKITELGTIFQQSIQPYFKVQPAGPVANPVYDFRLNAYITNAPALKTIVPEIERLDSISFQSRFSDKQGWTALLVAPVADIGDNHLRRLRLEAGTRKDRLDVKAAIQQFRSGKSIQLDNTTITASLANNTIDFVLNIRDRSSKDKYNLEGTVQQPRTGDYTISLKSKNLLLNYNSWDISADNKLIISGKKVNASDFVLRRGGQQLKITGQSQNANAPMKIEFSDFRLATLTGFVQTDSTFANGTINGRLTIIDMTSNPVFTGDLTIHELRLKNDTVGNLHLVMNNKVSDAYFADITITGRGNDVRLNGNYYPKSASGNFDFTLDIKQMPLTTAQAFSGGSIRNSSGSVNGKFTVKGTMDKPAFHGDLNFDKAAFTFSMLNSYFSIDQEKLAINSEGIQFNDFAIKDSAGNQLRINGTAATTDFSHYQFDMKVRANNFRALNSSKKDNRIFYGRLYFNTNMTIKGTEELPVVDGRLKVNEKTRMTIVLPQREPGVTEREGVIRFVDMDAPLNDSLFLVSYDSLNVTGFRGLDISMTIEVDKEADFTLIIDEGNGDFLNVKGEALLTASVDRSGQIILSGTYELESGTYELSFNFLRRKFVIQKGSKITWEGEPTKATVDVAAKYVANVAPLDLVKSQLGEDITSSQRNTYLQKLPFDVLLKMEGQLLQPKISFDIILPDNKSYIVSNDIITNVRTKLDQLRQEEGEMNKQVFSLLLLNRFVAENPFVSSTGTSVSTLARQSVSKLMTEQLNQLAAELVKGVDINFDIQSSEDYTTGERRDRTDLNVGLSKRLLDDRLTVTVGSNFELEGPQNSSQQNNNIAANIALDYKLSKDGRYLLRAYRKNEYEGVIDGYVVETGVGFIITVDYNHFREIFQSQKKRQEERRKRREAEMKEEEKDQQQSSPTMPANKNG